MQVANRSWHVNALTISNARLSAKCDRAVNLSGNLSFSARFTSIFLFSVFLLNREHDKVAAGGQGVAIVRGFVTFAQSTQ